MILWSLILGFCALYLCGAVQSFCVSLVLLEQHVYWDSENWEHRVGAPVYWRDLSRVEKRKMVVGALRWPGDTLWSWRQIQFTLERQDQNLTARRNQDRA